MTLSDTKQLDDVENLVTRKGFVYHDDRRILWETERERSVRHYEQLATTCLFLQSIPEAATSNALGGRW